MPSSAAPAARLRASSRRCAATRPQLRRRLRLGARARTARTRSDPGPRRARRGAQARAHRLALARPALRARRRRAARRAGRRARARSRAAARAARPRRDDAPRRPRDARRNPHARLRGGRGRLRARRPRLARLLFVRASERRDARLPRRRARPAEDGARARDRPRGAPRRVRAEGRGMSATLTLPPAADLFLSAPPLALERGGELPALELAYELVGPARAPDDGDEYDRRAGAVPCVVVQGGISAHPHVASSPRDPTPGWWSRIVGD